MSNRRERKQQAVFLRKDRPCFFIYSNCICIHGRIVKSSRYDAVFRNTQCSCTCGFQYQPRDRSIIIQRILRICAEENRVPRKKLLSAGERRKIFRNVRFFTQILTGLPIGSVPCKYRRQRMVLLPCFLRRLKPIYRISLYAFHDLPIRKFIILNEFFHRRSHLLLF